MSNIMAKNVNDLIKYSIENGIYFSDMDTETKDKLIKEICLRLLKLERESKEIESVLI